MNLANAFDFTGKTVVVTGMRGAVLRHARGFADHGANVVLLDRLVERGLQCAEEMGRAL